MSDSDTLGGIVRRRRLESGYSLGQLASKVGKTAAEVRAWERDNELPEHGILERLAETLELDLGEIQKRVSEAQTAAGKSAAKAASTKKAAGSKKKPAVKKPAAKRKPVAKKVAAGAGAAVGSVDEEAETSAVAAAGDEAGSGVKDKPETKKKPAAKKPAANKPASGAKKVAAAAAGAAGAAAVAESAGTVAASGVAAAAGQTATAPAAKKPAAKKPVAKKSAAMKPAAQKPAAEKPVDEASAAEPVTKPEDTKIPAVDDEAVDELPGFPVEDLFTPPSSDDVDPDFLDAPTEAVPVPVITNTAAAARAQRAAAVLEEPAPPLPMVEPAPDADPGLLRYLEPLRLLYDPNSRYLYWIRATLTVVVMMILAVVFFRMLGSLLDAISQLLDTIEPSAPSPDDLDALSGFRGLRA